MKFRGIWLAAAVMMAATPALADPPAGEVEALMKEYVRLWNLNDGAAITSRIYRFDNAANPMQTEAGFAAQYAQLKAQGYDHSDTESVHACLLSPNIALAEMRYSRMKTDGTAMPPAKRATLYQLKKRPEGWRVSEMITMDASAKFDCASYAGAPVPAMPAPTAPAPGASLIPAGVTERISQHVWAIPDQSRGLVPNVGIIVGAKAVLVVDTGMGTRNAETILAELAKASPEAPGMAKPIFIVSTHYHPEHDLGAHAFPKGSKMIRSTDEEKDIAQYGLTLANTFAQRSQLNAELLKGVKYRAADISFDKAYVLDLGGVKARIMAQGPNHTRGDTVILVEDPAQVAPAKDGKPGVYVKKTILFSGDIVMRGQPAFASPESSMSHWLESLNVLAAFHPTDIIPAHGPRGGPELIDGYRKYLGKIHNRAVALKMDGKSQAEAVTMISAEMPEQSDKGRLAGAIRNAWTEAK